MTVRKHEKTAERPAPTVAGRPVWTNWAAEFQTRKAALALIDPRKRFEALFEGPKETGDGGKRA